MGAKKLTPPAPLSTAKTIKLDIRQRLKIVQLLDESPTRSLGDSRLRLRLVEKIRLTDEEVVEFNVKMFQVQGATQITWKTPDSGPDLKTVFTLTNEEFSGLAAFFRDAGPSPADLREWCEDVLGQLGL